VGQQRKSSVSLKISAFGCHLKNAAGTLDLQSHVGVGTIITVLFPADRIVGSLHETEAVDEADRKAG
jgi:hypothetical protein